jgi:hypothetical protein
MPAHRHRSTDPETPVQSFSRIGQDGHLHQMYPFHAMSSPMAKIQSRLAALGLKREGPDLGFIKINCV